MQDVIAACAVAGALGAGSALGGCAVLDSASRMRRKSIREGLGAGSGIDGRVLNLECEGVHARVLTLLCVLSRQDASGRRRKAVKGSERERDLVAKAGLEDLATPEGCRITKIRLALAFAAAGAVVGAVLSPILFVIGLAGGAWFGWGALARALREEAELRCFAGERQLSHMIEVVSLGLNSGMSFDRALALYHRRFEGSLSSSLALAQAQWSHGLTDRSEALGRIARSYDSPLFGRLAENVVRSLRFGTSLAEGLALLSVEARAIRKAKLEEKVAKAPVKMLLPVGTLILPAMLILILGPVMLDLMAGI